MPDIELFKYDLGLKIKRLPRFKALKVKVTVRVRISVTVSMLSVAIFND